MAADREVRIKFDPSLASVLRQEQSRIRAGLDADMAMADRIARRMKPGLRTSRFPRRPLSRWHRG